MENLENDIFGIIYKAKNLTNGKVYIGQTSYSLDKRKSEHISSAKNKKTNKVVFYKAISKYGENSFEWEVIDCANSEEELNQKEIYWIDFYKSYIGFLNSNGYNMTLGGEGRVGYSHYEETKNKIREGQKNRDKDTYFQKEVLQFSLNGEFISSFKSAVICANAIGCNPQNITDCCREYKQKTVYGYIFIYKEDYNEDLLNKRIIELPSQNTKPREIFQFDINGNLLNKFDSIYSASKETNSDRSCIAKCCRGKIKKHNNFIWKYVN